MIRAGGYLRISSDPKDKRYGVNRQREDVTTLADVKGWQIVDWYPDNDRSASSGKERPEWYRLLSDVSAAVEWWPRRRYAGAVAWDRY